MILVDMIITKEDRAIFEEIKDWTASRLRAVKDENLPNFESRRLVELIRNFRESKAIEIEYHEFPKVLVVMPQDLPQELENLGEVLFDADWWYKWGSAGLEILDYENIVELLKELYEDWRDSDLTSRS